DEQHLDRRDYARLGLFLLRRDSGRVRLRRDARAGCEEGRSEKRRLPRSRLRSLEGLRLVARDSAVCGEVGWATACHRQNNRKNLRAELAEYRAADFNRFWFDRTYPAW